MMTMIICMTVIMLIRIMFRIFAKDNKTHDKDDTNDIKTMIFTSGQQGFGLQYGSGWESQEQLGGKKSNFHIFCVPTFFIYISIVCVWIRVSGTTGEELRPNQFYWLSKRFLDTFETLRFWKLASYDHHLCGMEH